MRKISIKPIITGCFLIFIGIAVNEKTLIFLFVEDGDIDSLTVRFVIFSYNLVFLAAGFIYIFKGWQINIPIPRRPEYWKTLICLFLLFFCTYQLTLAASALRPFPDFWFFGADSYRITYEHALNYDHPMARYQINKHPLYPVITVPLYYFGKTIFSFLPAPYGENFSLSFPSAIIGSLNICIAYAAFLRIGFNSKSALLPTFLYGFSAAAWFFSSFPETYALTSLMTNIFILSVIRDPSCKRWLLLAFLNALACYSTPQQILLGIIPTYMYLTTNGSKGLVPVIRYGAALFLMYVIPLWFVLTMVGRFAIVSGEVNQWTSFQISPELWGLVFLNFTVFSQFAPPLPPREFIIDSFEAIFQAPVYIWLSIFFVGLYGVWGYRVGKMGRLSCGPSLLVFILAYVVFFVVFGPLEAFLHSFPAVLPLWLVLHSGHVVQQLRRQWQIVILAAVIFSIVNNGTLAWELRHPDADMIRVKG